MDAFDAYSRYYDLLYREKSYGEEARFIAGLLREEGGAAGTLLDVGCGTGAHAREFAALGWRVTGVDRAPAMIEIARRRSAGAPPIDFVAAAAAEFDLGRQFDAVVSLFHVVSYHAEPDEAVRMLVNVRRHLVRGARFVFDFWHGPGVLADPPTVRVRRAEDDVIRVTRIAEPVHRPDERRIDVHYEIFIETIATRTLDRIREIHTLRYFFMPELEAMLAGAGFAIECTHAGITAAPLNDQAWYGLIVAQSI